MTVTELIAALEAVRAEHGDDVQVAVERFGDYLATVSELRVERRYMVARWPGRWVDADEASYREPPVQSAMVCYLEH